jgi:hypothetical protein
MFKFLKSISILIIFIFLFSCSSKFEYEFKGECNKENARNIAIKYLIHKNIKFQEICLESLTDIHFAFRYSIYGCDVPSIGGAGIIYVNSKNCEVIKIQRFQ